MEEQHHTHLGARHLAGNDGINRYVLLPGDPARAELIAAHFEDLEVVKNPRGHTAWLGRLGAPWTTTPVDVVAISSGMGPGSTEVILHELLTCGARRILRVGSCGAMSSGVLPGGVVIVTGAVRDERTTDHYAPREFPAVASPTCVQALVTGAARAEMLAHTWQGVCHTKASLYGREFAHGPAGERNESYKKWLARCGVVASDMEAAVLFVMASAWSAGKAAPLSAGSGVVPVQAGTVLAVYAGHDSDMNLDPAVVKISQERAIAVALHGIAAWAEADRAR